MSLLTKHNKIQVRQEKSKKEMTDNNIAPYSAQQDQHQESQNRIHVKH
jgi:hypothetical protein